MCILLGCDYCDSIRGIGPKRAVELIKQHRNIETILEHLDTEKYPIPADWPFKEARELFVKPDVKPGDEVEVLIPLSIIIIINNYCYLSRRNYVVEMGDAARGCAD